MLYLGHFSFTERDVEDAAVEGGWFTCLVEADSVEAAGEKFGDLLDSLSDSFEDFDSVGKVFLDDITEVRKLPEQGVLARFQQQRIEGWVSTTLPGVPQEFCVDYQWGRGEEAEDGSEEVHPFMVFEE